MGEREKPLNINPQLTESRIISGNLTLGTPALSLSLSLRFAFSVSPLLSFLPHLPGLFGAQRAKHKHFQQSKFVAIKFLLGYFARSSNIFVSYTFSFCFVLFCFLLTKCVRRCNECHLFVLLASEYEERTIVH